MGGLKINTNAQVIAKNGNVIPSLYAAGEVAGGIHAGNRLGGNSLADIFTFGRIAADSICKKRCECRCHLWRVTKLILMKKIRSNFNLNKVRSFFVLIKN